MSDATSIVASFDQAKRASIRDWAAVRVVSTRRSRGRHERRLEELHLIHHAQVDAGVPVAVQQHRRLLSNRARESPRKTAPDPDASMRHLGATPVRLLAHLLDDVAVRRDRWSPRPIARRALASAHSAR